LDSPSHKKGWGQNYPFLFSQRLKKTQPTLLLGKRKGRAEKENQKAPTSYGREG